MNYPLISISVATYNSDKTLLKTLESIKKQTYLQNKIEILIVDGGSTDKTLDLAKEYNCKIVPNPKTELIFAKHLGFLKASGKYLMFLDSDEVLENPNSLLLKYSTFKKNNKIKSIMLSGYKTPIGYPSINDYINEFGDPFSFFVYRESKGSNFFIKDWSNRYRVVYEDQDCVIFNFHNVKPLPLIDIFAGGCMIDLSFCKLNFPQLKTNPDLVAHLFYLLNSKNTLLAITKDDNTIHYSSENINKYLKKMSSRIKNNVFNTLMGQGGFLGREKYQTSSFKLKKFLFIPYTLSLIFPLIDSSYLAISRGKIIYLVHLPLCIYTSFLILYYYFLKLLNIKPKLRTYGK